MKRSQAIALLAGGAAGFPLAASGQAKRTIHVGANAGESLSEGLLALKAGFFSRAGLDVELVICANGGAMTTGIISGAIDVGPSNIASIAAAHIRGLELSVFAPSVLVESSDPPLTIIAVRSDSPIHTAKDCSGKTFALSTVRDLQQAAVMTWLDRNGGDSSSVSFVEMPGGSQLAALLSKRVDAALLVEPFLSESKADTRMVARPYDSLGSRLLTFGWVANNTWLAANVDVVPRLTAAIRETALWANRNHDATAAILSSVSKLPTAAYAVARQRFSDGQLDPAMIQPIIDASARYGVLKSAFPAADLIAARHA
jgi:NitT/TauT family transport system substrate-binding protein